MKKMRLGKNKLSGYHIDFYNKIIFFLSKFRYYDGRLLIDISTKYIFNGKTILNLLLLY